MSHQTLTIDEQTPSLETTVERIGLQITGKVLDKLKHYTWLEQMRSKIEGYIRADKTKTISSREIFDFIVEDAYKSFPQDLREELKEDSRIFLDCISQLSSLGIGPKSDENSNDAEDK